jgi:cyclohexa-1,5-dienecarbonyl-CoA hydratase
VAVRGQCLGGGLEVAAAGHLIFAAPGATLGQPEIKLAVFAPAASCLLPERIGQSRAEDLLFSGRSIGAEEAHRIGLVNALAEDPSQAALEYFEEHYAPRSAGSIRFAVRAARFDFVLRVRRKLAEVERLYLEELMATHDAVEGLTAFIAKRPAVWEDS